VRLAEALHRVNPEDARARMARLLALYPGNLAVLLGFSRVLAREGRFDEALRHLDEADEVAPGTREIQWARRRLERQRKEWNVDLGEGEGEPKK
jgi:tetratricopeptide (TPR) repeat protein